MQSRPRPAPNLPHSPIQPHVPLQAINSLIPRLTTTINDIDAFKALLAAGNADGSLPNWDALLQRYSLLLGRINAFSTYLAQPTPPPPGSRPSIPTSNQPALSRYIVHPLNPLPSETSPLAPETFYQVINTQPLASVSSATSSLLSSEPWVPLDQLKRMSDGELERLGRGLQDRLEREGNKVTALRAEIEDKEEEVDWGLRIGVGEKGGEGGDEDEEDDLFADGGDDDEPKRATVKPTNGEAKEEGLSNPREGWTVEDYVRFLESGREPGPPQ